MKTDVPKITAIMPTGGERWRFAAQAISYFNAQTYPNKELVVIDSSVNCPDPLSEVVPYQDNIEYVRISTPTALTIGAKRNLAASLATGEIICHYDDDDVWGPERLWKQAAPILRGEADVTGMPMRLCLHVTTMRLWRCSAELHRTLFPHDIRCGTLMYTKKLINETIWYPNVSRGEDVWFLSRLLHHGARLVSVDDPASYICVRHGGNITDEMEYGPPGWQEEPIERYLSDDVIAFYAGMRETAKV